MISGGVVVSEDRLLVFLILDEAPEQRCGLFGIEVGCRFVGVGRSWKLYQSPPFWTAGFFLQTLGHNVLTARNGLEAVAILRKNSRVSILFTDIQMPGMGGEEPVEIAVALRPGIRVIFTSGWSRPRADASFLQKPYRTADLIRLFRRRPFH
jgi:hypothetical protein